MTELKVLLVSLFGSMAIFSHHIKRYPAFWLKQERCVHLHEAVNWHQETTWNGRPTRQRGGLQIDFDTWNVYAPKSFPRDPGRATIAQQIFVGWLIYVANGRVWGTGKIGTQWPNSARECGLR